MTARWWPMTEHSHRIDVWWSTDAQAVTWDSAPSFSADDAAMESSFALLQKHVFDTLRWATRE